MNVKQYVNITTTADYFTIQLEPTKTNSALQTLTQLQKLVDSKKTIINKTGFSLSTLALQIRDNYKNKLTWWKKLIDWWCGGHIFGLGPIYALAHNILLQNSKSNHSTSLRSAQPPLAFPPKQDKILPKRDLIQIQPMDPLSVPSLASEKVSVKERISVIIEKIEVQLAAMVGTPSNSEDDTTAMENVLTLLKERDPINITEIQDQFRTEDAKHKQLSDVSKLYSTNISEVLSEIKAQLESLDETNTQQILGIAEMFISDRARIYSRLRFIAKEINISIEPFIEEIRQQLTPFFCHFLDLKCPEVYLKYAYECEELTRDFLVLQLCHHHFKQKEYKKAYEILFYSTFKFKPNYQKNNIQLRVNLAIKFFQEKNYIDAKRCVNDILRIDPTGEMSSESSQQIIKHINECRF